MGDSTDDKDKNSGSSRSPDGDKKEPAEGDQERGEEGTVAVESKNVEYVIMNPDFYKEPKKSVRITGPSSAHEYITRKPRG